MIETLGRRGLKNIAFCLLLTDRGILLIHERIRDEVIPGVFGFASTRVSEHVHPEADDLTKLVENKDFVIIPYERLRRIGIVKGFSSATLRKEYKIAISYSDSSEKQKRFLADIVPPLSPSGRDKGSMQDRAASIKAYALEAVELLKRVLPDNREIISEISP